MNPHIVKPKIISITSLRNGIMNLKDFTMLSIRVRWQVYMPNDSIPISWINLLNLLLLFKFLRAIPTITRTASIAVPPLYVYCNNDVGKVRYHQLVKSTFTHSPYVNVFCCSGKCEPATNSHEGWHVEWVYEIPQVVLKTGISQGWLDCMT